MSLSSEERPLSATDRRLTAVLKGCLYAGMAFVIAMTFVTVVHGVGRYGFAKPVPGLVELSSYFLVAAVFLVGAYTMLVKGHVSIGILADRLPKRVQKINDSFGYILCVVIAIFALWQAGVRGVFLMGEGQASPVLHIPNFPFYYIVAVGWGIFGLAAIIHLVNLFRRVVKE